jgi:hypothetical protein
LLRCWPKALQGARGQRQEVVERADRGAQHAQLGGRKLAARGRGGEGGGADSCHRAQSGVPRPLAGAGEVPGRAAEQGGSPSPPSWPWRRGRPGSSHDQAAAVDLQLARHLVGPQLRGSGAGRSKRGRWAWLRAPVHRGRPPVHTSGSTSSAFLTYCACSGVSNGTVPQLRGASGVLRACTPRGARRGAPGPATGPAHKVYGSSLSLGCSAAMPGAASVAEAISLRSSVLAAWVQCAADDVAGGCAAGGAGAAGGTRSRLDMQRPVAAERSMAC